MRKLSPLSNKNHVRYMFYSLVFVLMLEHLAGTIVNIIDSLCISQFLGDKGLAAASLTSPIIQIIGAISGIFAVGSELVITKLIAKAEKEKANNNFIVNFIFLSVLGFTIGAVLFIAARPISIALSSGMTSEDTITLATKYIRGFAIGIPFMFINELFLSIVYLDNDKLRATLSIGALFIINAGLDLLLAQFCDNKAFVIGLASSISFIVSSFILLTHFLSKKSLFKFKFKKLEFKNLKDSFIQGLPVGVKNGMITLRLFLMNLIMLTVGNKYMTGGGDLIVAAHGIESTISNFFETGLGGVISSVIMLGSIFYGEEDEKCLNELLKQVVIFSFIFNGVLAIAYFISAPYISNFMSSDSEVIKQATYAMRCSAIFLIFTCLNTAFLAFLQACKKYKYSYISTFLQSLFLPVCSLAAFGFTLGVKGIWFGMYFGFFLYMMVHVIFSFIRSKKIKFNVRVLFFLDDGFGFSKDEIYERDILCIQDAYKLVPEILEFGKKLNIDELRRQNIANAAEELAVLIILSGFTKELKKKHMLSIRVLYKKKTNKILIRTRDDCAKFDIKERSEKIKNGSSTDLALNCSLKMIMHMCKDIEYTHVLKTNNVILTL